MENREILFRGFDSENNCWRYGYYTKLQDGIRKFDAIICDEDGTLARYYIHNPQTIGQFTGLLDKNGTKIFEGDVMSTDLGKNLLIIFEDCSFRRKQINYEYNYSIPLLSKYDIDDHNFKIIGTIHDHLLKGE